MEKVLKPYTIIPDRLYVPRDADRQLAEIINDMQRPGYVLVSRQMGKTNLLLHAEEKLADKENDIFIYIDLSNSFKDAKDCFENIINTILEVHEEKLQDVAIKIKELRELNSEVAEFMQHIKELRLILGHISGKLVIILDEIDALTKVKYSDIIFTQIRSIYFSRRNIKALNRLTYILSGVVEPKEIIKNQDISPFNIGQKIFLNDFSYDEFLLFIEKSKLKLEKNVIDHIYEWTNGNPRITWDICAEVEQCLSTNVINNAYIDKIVNQIYLTAYDKPPIDNIRQLIKDDSELRNNVKMLLSGSIKNISDRMKNKLYLAGIINYSYDSSEIIIKNKVVKHSIDLKWIKSIEEEDKGLFSLAMELYYRSEFQEALEIFSKFLETDDFPIETKSDGYYFMAVSAYNIPDYNLSMEYLKKTSFTNEDRFYYDANHLYGVLFNHLGDIDASLDSFLLVLKKLKKTEGYLVALSDFGQIALGSKNHKNITDTKNKFLEIADGDFNKGDVTEEFFYKYQSITYYFLALLCIRDNEIEKSRDYFKQSLEFAKDIYKPNIILGLFATTENAVDRYNLLEMVVNLILEKELIPIEKSELSYHVFDYNMFRTILIYLYALEDQSLYQKIRSKIYLLGDESLASNLFSLVSHILFYNHDMSLAIKILEELYINVDNSEYLVDEYIKYETYKLLAFYYSTESKLSLILSFIDLLMAQEEKVLSVAEIEIVGKVIVYYIQQKDFKKALSYVYLIESLKEYVTQEASKYLLGIYHLNLIINTELSDGKKVQEIAKEILSISNNKDLEKQHIELFGDDVYNNLIKNVEYILEPKIAHHPAIIIDNNIGRNQKVKVQYKYGFITTKKFKQVELDVKQNLCQIIEVIK